MYIYIYTLYSIYTLDNVLYIIQINSYVSSRIIGILYILHVLEDSSMMLHRRLRSDNDKCDVIKPLKD